MTAVEHRESNSGKKYGVVNLEDYTDSFRLFLFGTDYTDFKNLLTEGWVLFIKGRVQEKKWGDTDQLELKVNKIELLDQLLDSENRNLIVEIPFDLVNDKIIDELLSSFVENKGGHTLKFKLMNYKDKYSVDLLSRNTKVDLNKKLFRSLNKINDVKVSIET